MVLLRPQSLILRLNLAITVHKAKKVGIFHFLANFFPKKRYFPPKRRFFPSRFITKDAPMFVVHYHPLPFIFYYYHYFVLFKSRAWYVKR